MSNAKRPSTTRKTTPKSEANRRAQHDEAKVSIRVEGEVYTVSPADMTGLQEAEVRKVTGHSLTYLVNTLMEDPGVDVLGGFMWVAELQAGRKADYEDILASISYASEVEMTDVKGDAGPEA